MKAYLFYKRPPQGFDQSKLTLYAYTTDSKFAQEFKAERNMDVFICKEIKDITDEEFRNFEKNNSKYKLIYVPFYTSALTYGQVCSVKVLCTFNEEYSIMKNSDRLWDDNRWCLCDVQMLQDKYLKALDKLLYIRLYLFFQVKFLCNPNAYYEPYYNDYEYIDQFVFSEFKNNFRYDDLKLFLKFYQDTFKNKKNNRT